MLSSRPSKECFAVSFTPSLLATTARGYRTFASDGCLLLTNTFAYELWCYTCAAGMTHARVENRGGERSNGAW